MKIFVVTAEHPEIPGRVIRAYTTMRAAEDRAVEFINTLLKDYEMEQEATRENWRSHLAAVQDLHGARYCYVEIELVEVDKD